MTGDSWQRERQVQRPRGARLHDMAIELQVPGHGRSGRGHEAVVGDEAEKLSAVGRA